MKTHFVVCAYIIHDNKVLLIHHKKHSKWLPPGGHIEENETPDEALHREIKEEIGIEIETLQNNILNAKGSTKKELAIPFYINVHNVGDHDHCCFFYLCKPLTNKIKIKKDEINDAKWFSKEDLDSVTEDVRKISIEALKISQEIA